MQQSDKSYSQTPLVRRLLWLLPLFVFIGFAIVFYTRLGKNPQVQNNALVGKDLPAFSLNELSSGETKTLQHLPKDVFLLNVWGSWCPSCIEEAPYLSTLANNGVVLIGLNYKDDATDAMDYLIRYGNPYRFNLQDLEGKYSIQLGITGAPETFVVGLNKRIYQHHLGVITETVYTQKIKPCMDALRQLAVNTTETEVNACQP